MTYLGPSLRRRRRIHRPWQRVAMALAVSLVANLAILGAVRVDWIGKKISPEQVRPVQLAPLSAAQWQANRGGLPSPSKPPPLAPPVVPPPRPPPETPRPPGSVVNVGPSTNGQPPKDARFSAETNNSVDKETRSRDARPGYAHALPKPTSPSPRPPAPPAAVAPPGGSGGQERAGDGRKAGASGQGGKPRTREQQPQQRLALQWDPSGRLRGLAPGERDQSPAPPATGVPEPPGRGGEGGTGSRPGQPGAIDPRKLAPSAAYYDQLAGGPAPDHLPEVEEGEGTYLNTREWKFASYFNRIKQAVGAHWDPDRELLARDPTGSVFGYRDRVTVLDVRLNQEGSLIGIQVQKTSGVDFLDRTAMEAFRKAQPFVNPPRDLTDTHGEIRFAFGFYLEFGSPGLRIFRGSLGQ